MGQAPATFRHAVTVPAAGRRVHMDRLPLHCLRREVGELHLLSLLHATGAWIQWEIESANMGSVCAGAYVTIAAGTASCDSDGFLHEVDARRDYLSHPTNIYPFNNSSRVFARITHNIGSDSRRPTRYSEMDAPREACSWPYNAKGNWPCLLPVGPTM